LGTPRLSASKRASEEPPGNPPRPFRSAMSTFSHFSPKVPAMRPEDSFFGHRPLRSW
jgi:hypothetical protein